jgi:general L-amino acid transport system substrate-binding protein
MRSLIAEMAAPVRLMAFAFLLLCQSDKADAATLDTVRERGALSCALQADARSVVNDPGQRSGAISVDVDLCRALAAAILGDPSRIDPVLASLVDRIEAVESGAADVGFGSLSITARRGLRLEPALVYRHESQGFMADASLGLKRAADAGAVNVCVNRPSASFSGLADFIALEAPALKPMPFASNDASLENYLAGRCPLITGDIGVLAQQRAALALPPDRHVILADRISHEPIAAWTRRQDHQWLQIIRWTLNALILAEELGVTQAKVDTLSSKPFDPVVRRLLGLDRHPLMELGLDADSIVRMLRAVGNYGEIYERAYGPGSIVPEPRGRNALIRDGGLIYSLPYR